MAIRLVELAPGRRIRGPRVEVWNTVSAWLWAAYLAGLAAAFGWWML